MRLTQEHASSFDYDRVAALLTRFKTSLGVETLPQDERALRARIEGASARQDVERIWRRLEDVGLGTLRSIDGAERSEAIEVLRARREELEAAVPEVLDRVSSGDATALDELHLMLRALVISRADYDAAKEACALIGSFVEQGRITDVPRDRTLPLQLATQRGDSQAAMLVLARTLVERLDRSVRFSLPGDPAPLLMTPLNLTKSGALKKSATVAEMQAQNATFGLSEARWAELAASFPRMNGVANFLTGSAGVAPRQVIQATAEALIRINEQSPLGESKGWEVADKARDELAGHFGARPTELLITSSTSEGLKEILSGLVLERGDQILTTDDNHHGSFDRLRELEAKDGIALGVVPIADLLSSGTKQQVLDALLSAIDERKPKVLVLTHISGVTGAKLPIEEISAYCRERGILTVVDGAHAPGHIKLDLADLGCDVYAAALHKWMGVPETAFLFVREEVIPRIKPNARHRGHDTSGSIDKFERPGAASPAKYAGLSSALEIHRGLTQEAVEHRIHDLADRLRAGLSQIPGVRVIGPKDPELASGIVAFTLPSLEDYAELAERLLKEHRIHLAASGQGASGAVRVTTNINLGAADIDHLVSSIASVVRDGKTDLASGPR